MRGLIFIVLFSTAHNVLYAQKRIVKTIENPQILKVDINANQAFNVFVSTKTAAVFKIEAAISGEHYEHVSLQTKIDNNTLKITPEFQPFFIPFQDKLSAHKVISIDLYLTLPKGLHVNISSDIASVSVTGDYKMLISKLFNGNCKLFEFNGNAVIQTIKGNIFAAVSNADVSATSRNGEVVIQDALDGNYSVLLESVDGNIIVKNKY